MMMAMMMSLPDGANIRTPRSREISTKKSRREEGHFFSVAAHQTPSPQISLHPIQSQHIPSLLTLSHIILPNPSTSHALPSHSIFPPRHVQFHPIPYHILSEPIPFHPIPFHSISPHFFSLYFTPCHTIPYTSK